MTFIAWIWNSVVNAYDLALVDAFNIACSALFPIQRWLRWKTGRIPQSPHILLLFMDFCRGATFFPFVLIIVGVPFPPVLKVVLELNKGALFMAGVIGAVSVFKADRWLIDYLNQYKGGG
jgi:hypothetical protein